MSIIKKGKQPRFSDSVLKCILHKFILKIYTQVELLKIHLDFIFLHVLWCRLSRKKKQTKNLYLYSKEIQIAIAVALNGIRN